MVRIKHVQSDADLNNIRQLFKEYQDFLGLDLSFQSFDDELNNLPGKYSKPGGALLIAMDGDEPIGCVGVRKFKDGVCEMKRLFVRSQYQGRGIGRQLAIRIIEEATELGYQKMWLDTLSTLKEANKLYRSLGFKEIEPYNIELYSPLPNTLFFELVLK